MIKNGHKLRFYGKLCQKFTAARFVLSTRGAYAFFPAHYLIMFVFCVNVTTLVLMKLSYAFCVLVIAPMPRKTHPPVPVPAVIGIAVPTPALPLPVPTPAVMVAPAPRPSQLYAFLSSKSFVCSSRDTNVSGCNLFQSSFVHRVTREYPYLVSYVQNGVLFEPHSGSYLQQRFFLPECIETEGHTSHLVIAHR